MVGRRGFDIIPTRSWLLYPSMLILMLIGILVNLKPSTLTLFNP